MPELYRHQVQARDFLARNDRAILADEPGAGKTAPVIRAALVRGFTPDQVVIVCPAVAKTMWMREWERWWPEPSAYRPLVISYDKLVADDVLFEYIRKASQSGLYKLLVLDEAHYLGNIIAQRTMRVLGPEGIARTMEAVWALSGTVMQRHPEQLYPLLRAFWPHIIRSGYARWTDIFCEKEWRTIPGKRKQQQVIVGGKNLDRLNHLLFAEQTPLRIMRRTLEQVGINLPDLVWMAAQHENTKDDLFLGEGELFSPEQAKADNTYRLCGEAKARKAAEMVLDDMYHGTINRPLIFAYHLSVIDILKKMLSRRGFPVYVITGNVRASERQRMIDEFQSVEGQAVMIAQITTMETAVTLTNADRVELVESTWNAAKDEQAVKRAHRLGQTRPLVARVHMLANTVDDAIQSRQLRQKDERSIVGL